MQSPGSSVSSFLLSAFAWGKEEEEERERNTLRNGRYTRGMGGKMMRPADYESSVCVCACFVQLVYYIGREKEG